MKILIALIFLTSSVANAISIVASNSILASIAQDLVGPISQVKSLIGPEQDPHMFELKPQDLIALEKAEIVFLNGEGLESWELQYQRKNPSKKIVSATSGMDLLPLTEGKNQIKDPHFWHDPRLAIHAAENLQKQIIELHPELKGELETRFKKLQKTYKTLFEDCQKSLKNLPTRKIVTSHEAFNYLGRAYGLQIVSPQGWSSQGEPRPHDVAAIRNLITSHKVGALFFENGVESSLLRKLSQQSDVKTGGSLFSDTLSSAGGPAPTYQKMQQTNCETLSKALR